MSGDTDKLAALTAGEDQRPGESVTGRLVDAARVASTPDRPPAASAALSALDGDT